VGAGEWLFGPAVTAQYGGTFLWLATLSILFQVVYNLEVMRYALYCGEPIFVGFFRMPPGPRFWMVCYMILFLAHIWPFMASNSAVPLAAAILGHLPGDDRIMLLGASMSEVAFVKLLGYVIFFLAFVPLIFGGKVATTLERLMAVKLVLVFGFLVVVSLLMVTPRSVREILTGFVRFGQVALRADTVIAAPHFSMMERDGSDEYTVQGSLEHEEPVVTAFLVRHGATTTKFGMGARLPDERLQRRRAEMAERAAALARREGFFVRSQDATARCTVSASGRLRPDRSWQLQRVEISNDAGQHVYTSQDAIPPPYGDVVRSWVENQGFQRVSLWGSWRRSGHLPDVDWGLLAAFAAIAGAGGLSNALFSNFARDKGWGMGAKTGAIASAIGGSSIQLSPVGMVFPVTPTTLERWRGWYRHIARDQIAVWMVCSVVGLALPCMLSLEFLRNMPVADHRVAAMAAEGIASRSPEWGRFLWSLTLLVGFLILAPCAVYSGDLLARHWTDILWITSPAVRRLARNQARCVYYSLLGVFLVWGVITLAFLSPLQIAKVGAILGNVALGFSAFHTLFVNRTLLPRELRPNIIMQLGLVGCGLFFFAITVAAVVGS
jgi:hypothetical protein